MESIDPRLLSWLQVSLPSWAQAVLTVGATVVVLLGWLYRGIRASSDPSPQLANSRMEFIDIYIREMQANRLELSKILDGVLAIAHSCNEMSAIMRSEADDSRMAQIAERVSRAKRRDDEARADGAR